MRASRLLVTLPLVLVLAGCVAQADPTASDTAAPSARPTDKPSSAPTPTQVEPAPTPEPVEGEPVVPVARTCGDVIPLDAMFAFDPLYLLVADSGSVGGTLGQEAVAAGGISCQWQHETNGTAIDLTVTSLGEGGLGAAKAVAGDPVPDYAAEGFFQTVNDRGPAQAFPGAYRVSLESLIFLQPGDAAPLMDIAIGSLG
jgi:hypothetical protein